MIYERSVFDQIDDFFEEFKINIKEAEVMARNYDNQFSWSIRNMNPNEYYLDEKTSVLNMIRVLLSEDVDLNGRGSLNVDIDKQHYSTIESLKSSVYYCLNYTTLEVLNALLLMYLDDFDLAYYKLSIHSESLLDHKLKPETYVRYGCDEDREYFLYEGYYSRPFNPPQSKEQDLKDQIVEILILRDFALYCDRKKSVEDFRLVLNYDQFEGSVLSNLFYLAVESIGSTGSRNFRLYRQFLVFIISLQENLSEFHLHQIFCNELIDYEISADEGWFSIDYSSTYEILDMYIKRYPESIELLKLRVMILLNEMPHDRSVFEMEKYCEMGLKLNVDNDFFSKSLEKHHI